MPYVPDIHNLTDVDRYWVGYFRADGCIGQDGRASFSQSTLEPVQAFIKYLGLPAWRCSSYVYEAQPPGSPNRRQYNGHRMSWLPVGRVYKALGVKGDLVDDSLYSDPAFWRGMIDGDGCVQIRSNGRPCVYLCGSHFDVSKFSDFCLDLFETRPSLSKNGSIFVAGVSGDKAVYLCRKLYINKYSALPAKRAKALIAASRPYGKTDRYARYKLNVQEAPHEADTC